jgi:adenylate cyclase class 2
VKEREIKYRLMSKESYMKLKEWLSKECSLKSEVLEIDDYFQHPCRDFGLTDEALRLRRDERKEQVRIYLTYKGPRETSYMKVREEINIELASSKCHDEMMMKILLEKLGFKHIATIEKKRIEYDCKSYTASLDIVKDLGLFVEFELKPEANPNELFGDIEKILGQNVELELVEQTYLELFLSGTRN